MTNTNLDFCSIFNLTGGRWGWGEGQVAIQIMNKVKLAIIGHFSHIIDLN